MWFTRSLSQVYICVITWWTPSTPGLSMLRLSIRERRVKSHQLWRNWYYKDFWYSCKTVLKLLECVTDASSSITKMMGKFITITNLFYFANQDSGHQEIFLILNNIFVYHKINFQKVSKLHITDTSNNHNKTKSL